MKLRKADKAIQQIQHSPFLCSPYVCGIRPIDDGARWDSEHFEHENANDHGRQYGDTYVTGERKNWVGGGGICEQTMCTVMLENGRYPVKGEGFESILLPEREHDQHYDHKKITPSKKVIAPLLCPSLYMNKAIHTFLLDVCACHSW